MLPNSAVAAFFLLSLIPGWVYLRASATRRVPRTHTAWSEVLSTAAAGLATTGVSVGVGVWVSPGAVLRLFDAPASEDDVQAVAVTLASLVVGAIGVALLLAAAVRATSRKRYASSAWLEALGHEAPEGQRKYLYVGLTDGRVVGGVLRSYTVTADATHRDITLQPPIRMAPSTADDYVALDDCVSLTVADKDIVTIEVYYTAQPTL